MITTKRLLTHLIILSFGLVLVSCSALHSTHSQEGQAGAQVTKTSKPVPSSALTGLDVSHFQGDVNWHSVFADDIHFVFIKASQGQHTVDGQFARNRQTLNELGATWGAYHYLDPSLDGEKQAQHFLQTITEDFGNLPPVVDIEAFEKETPAEVIMVLKDFLAHVQEQIHCKAIIYTSPHFWDALSDHEFGQHPLWLADYSTEPTLPEGWSNWTFWQFTSQGKTNGVDGPVDHSIFRGDLSALAKKHCSER